MRGRTSLKSLRQAVPEETTGWGLARVLSGVTALSVLGLKPHKNGAVFLVDCFHGNEKLADSVKKHNLVVVK